MSTVDLLTPRPVFMAQMNTELFTLEFLLRLASNLKVYEAFEREALRVVAKGRTHYSARTIIEVLRHNSALSDVDAEWKLNDHATPFYARLFGLCNPEHADLFELRTTKSVKRVEAFA